MLRIIGCEEERNKEGESEFDQEVQVKSSPNRKDCEKGKDEFQGVTTVSRKNLKEKEAVFWRTPA